MVVSQAPKQHEGKAPAYQVHPLWIQGISVILSNGARSKYGPYNWLKKGTTKATDYLEPLERHMSRWGLGEDVDKDTPDIPHSHLLACAANLMMLWCGLRLELIEDNRPFKLKQENKT